MIVRLILGYLFWLFLGPFGVHRFFLGRPKSGLTLLILTVTALALLVGMLFSLEPENLQDPAALASLGRSSSAIAVAVLSGIVSLWLLADLVLVALMVLKDSEQAELARQEAGSTVALTANMDPSFQAVQQAAGLDEFDDRPRRKALPDDYVMPWRRENPRGEQKIYRPDED